MKKNKQPGEVLEVTFKALDKMLEETSKDDQEKAKQRQRLKEQAKKAPDRFDDNKK